MANHTRTTCFDARLIRGLVGTTITTYDLVSDGASPESTSLAHSSKSSPDSPSSIAPSALVASPVTLVSTKSGISRTWLLMEKLSERATPMTDHDIKMGRGSAKTVGKFLCRLTEDPNQTAFMRIYQQIPITGTEDADHDTLAGQAVPPEVCGELESFKLLQSGRCKAAPRFLGYAESTQGDDGLVPGGYIRYIVWEKVPGEPLTTEFFWGLDDTARKDIRSKFRAAYEQILACGVAPGEASISKIIFEQSTGNLHISGFRRGWPIIDKLEWSKACYVEFELAKLGTERDWINHPENWQW